MRAHRLQGRGRSSDGEIGVRANVDEHGGRPIIDAQGLTRRFGDVVALHDLTLQVHHGEVFGILGHNGAGKTTFLRLVNGLLEPSGGELHTFGQPAYTGGATNRARTGVVTESTALDDFLTIGESLVAYGTMSGRSFTGVDERVDELLSMFGLSEVRDKQARELSAGMRQRAAFARGLMHRPELLLLDEPTANMDPVAARQVRQVVASLARETGRTVVLSTHNLAEAQEVCDRIAVLRRGQLQALGTMAELSQMVGRGAGQVMVTTLPGQADVALAVAHEFGESRIDGRPDVIVLRHADVSAIPQLVAALVAAGVSVKGVTEIEPALEDVYLALHHRSSGV
jgi:ABC-2 type transport system ATP-binding protein